MKRLKRMGIILLSATLLFGCTTVRSENDKDIKQPVKGQTASEGGTTKKPQGITVNKINFEVVGNDVLPPNMTNSINNFKANRGYLVYEDKGYYYIAVFVGRKNTGGYSIKVVSIEDNEGKTYVTVEEKSPEPNMNVTQAITYPYTIIKATGITPNITVQTTKGDYLEKVMKAGEIY